MTTEIEGMQEEVRRVDAPQTAIVRYMTGESLAVTREPEEVLADAQKAAAALMKVVSSKKKQITFNNETYLESGDWQTVAKFYGVTAKVESTRFVEYGGAHGFEAAAVAIDCNGREVSRGEAMCLNDEENWGMRARYEWQDVLDAQGKKIWEYNAAKGKNLPKREKVQVGEVATPLFQLRSMAQTRACAKALSNLFKWVVVLAGYKPTPAEEMTETVEESEPSPSGTTSTQTTTPQPSSASAGAAPSGTTSAEPDIRPRSQKGAQPSTQPPQAAQGQPQPQQQAIEGQVEAVGSISNKQVGRMMTIARCVVGTEKGVAEKYVDEKLASIGYRNSKDMLPWTLYDKAIDAIDPQQKFHTNK